MLPVLAAIGRAVLPEVLNTAAKVLGGGSESKAPNPADDII
ncbi:hypothetical protein [Duganella sp. Root1480D1]|nr:hypothetical protein [Duganella sp. Root1480D1]